MIAGLVTVVHLFAYLAPPDAQGSLLFRQHPDAVPRAAQAVVADPLEHLSQAHLHFPETRLVLASRLPGEEHLGRFFGGNLHGVDERFDAVDILGFPDRRQKPFDILLPGQLLLIVFVGRPLAKRLRHQFGDFLADRDADALPLFLRDREIQLVNVLMDFDLFRFHLEQERVQAV